MKRCMQMVLATCLGTFTSLAAADEGAGSDARLVSLQFTIAEFSARGKEHAKIPLDSMDEALARLRELEEQNAIDSLSRVRLATVNNSQASMQLGATEPAVTGMAAPFGPGGGRGGRPNDAAIAMTRSFTMQNVGTLISVTPTLLDDGSVLADITFESSRLEKRDAANDDDAAPSEFTPASVTKLSVRATLRIPSGQSVLLGGWHSFSDQSSEALIIVTAQVGDAPATASDTTQLQVFQLANSQAGMVSKLLNALYEDGAVKIVADERTNSLVVNGSSKRLQVIEALVLRLDQPETAAK